MCACRLVRVCVVRVLCSVSGMCVVSVIVECTGICPKLSFAYNNFKERFLTSLGLALDGAFLVKQYPPQ